MILRNHLVLTQLSTVKLLSHSFSICMLACSVFWLASFNVSAKEIESDNSATKIQREIQTKSSKNASKSEKNDKASAKSAGKKGITTKSAERKATYGDKKNLTESHVKQKVVKNKDLKPKVEQSKVEHSRVELSNIHQRIESLQKDLANKQEAQADVTDALKQSEKSISDTNRKLFELNQKHKENRSTLNVLQQKRVSLESTIAQQKALLASQYYQQYIHGKPNYIQVVLQEQQPGAIARQLEYLGYISRARSQLIESMNDNLATVTKLNAQTADTLKQIAMLKTEQEKQHLALVSEKNERSQMLVKLSTQISAQRNEIEKLKRDEANLSQLVENLTRKLAEQAARQKLARNQPKPNKAKANQAHEEPSRPDKSNADKNDVETAAPQRSTTVARNDTLPSEAFEGGNFAQLRGKLNLPVRGELTNHFGDARADTGVLWKGLFIRANEGSEVKSIASGRVVFADWMRGFGNLLIIDHGDGYMSLYGNNQALLRKVGSTVKGGETVASVGNSGGNETNGLYYELRKQSRPFDPLSWSVVR